jgi:phosphoglycerol transferase
VLLGIIGGFGFLFAVLVSNAIRSYNRISTYIAFFSLMAVAVGLETLYRRTAKKRIVFYALCGLVLIGGFWDQTAHYYIPDYSGTKSEFLNDADFVNRIEASVPAGAMIFQLPYFPFPENGTVHEMHDYDHLRGYLHSKNLRWSYGTIKGRPGDRAQQRVVQLPPAEFVEALVAGGFSGIYLDRNGYEDGAAAMESELSKILQSKPLVSANARLLFFNLTDYGRSLREKIPDSEWQTKQALSFYPLVLDWTGGFSGLETSPGKTWRWCSNEGELRLNNTSKLPRTISLEMSFATGRQEINDFFISGLISEQLKVGWELVPYSKTVVVPPGESVIKFRSTAGRVDAPLDPRFLVFRIENFKMTELQ